MNNLSKIVKTEKKLFSFKNFSLHPSLKNYHYYEGLDVGYNKKRPIGTKSKRIGFMFGQVK